jgi:D-alanine-D-alanine ligase
MKKIKLGLIFGGPSGEHEVSLSSAMSVYENLDKDKYDISRIAITKKGNWLVGGMGNKYMEVFKDRAGKENGISEDESESMVIEPGIDINSLKKLDIILPILHGPYGEDGKLQGFLETIGVKYVFSKVLAHALGMNKKLAKVIAEDNGVQVCRDIVLKKDNYNIEDLSYPLIVKPIELGSSVGIQKAENSEELKNALNDAWRYGDQALVEEYKKGREFTVTVLENKNEIKALMVTEIIPIVSEFYDYKAKYEDGGSKHTCPAELDARKEEELKVSAVSIFKALGCKDLARADFVMDQAGKCYFIDLNTIPGMTKTSLAPEAAQKAGYKFSDFLDILITNNLN